MMSSSMVVIMLTLVAVAMGCKRPPDYKTKPIPEVLAMSDLTIVGTMTGYDVVKKPDDYLHVKYNTNIKCVVKNTKKIPLTSNFNITSIQYKTLGNANTCEMAYIGKVTYNVEQTIMIRPYKGMPGEFFFNDVNFQGPFFVPDMSGVEEKCNQAYSISSLEPILGDDASTGSKTLPAFSIAIAIIASLYHIW